MGISFAEQVTFSAGTSLLVVGYRSYPEQAFGNLINDAQMGAVGRLMEPWRPGQSLLMQEGPLSINLPALGSKGTVTMIVGGDSKPVEDGYEKHIRSYWKKGVGLGLNQLCEKMGCWLPDDLGNYYYRIFEDVTGLVDTLPREEKGSDWTAKLMASREIIRHVEWRHGSEYCGYHNAILDPRTLELEL